jgi:hypothetical protein
MHIDEIRVALGRQPFQPFVMRLADGRSVQVPHPETVALGRRVAIVVNPVDDSSTFLEPLLIVSIDYGPAPTAPPSPPGAGNGPPA